MKTKRKPPTAKEYNQLLRDAADWRKCSYMLLVELIQARIDTTWRWRSPAIKQYDRLSQRNRVPWPNPSSGPAN